MLIATVWTGGFTDMEYLILFRIIYMFSFVIICGNVIFLHSSYVVESTYKLVVHSLEWEIPLPY